MGDTRVSILESYSSMVPVRVIQSNNDCIGYAETGEHKSRHPGIIEESGGDNEI